MNKSGQMLNFSFTFKDEIVKLQGIFQMLNCSFTLKDEIVKLQGILFASLLSLPDNFSSLLFRCLQAGAKPHGRTFGISVEVIDICVLHE